MNAPRVVLCWVLLASSLGFAQAPAPAPSGAPLPPPPLVPAPATPEPLVPAPAQPEAPAPQGELIPRASPSLIPPSPRFEPGRVAFEALGGVVGGVGLGLGSALLVGGLMELSTDCSSEDSGCALVAAVLALPALAVGIPFGVSIAGRLMGGKGRFLPALGGMFAGLGASLLLALTGSGLVLGLGLVTLPIAGAIVGYELSHPEAPRLREAGEGYGSEYTRGGFQVLPVLGLTPRGGFMGGLAARF
jgi:hypothetical protein